MASKVTCSSCGWSWNKSDSSKKDMYVCHQCGKDNTMKNGGWLNKFEDVPEAQNGIEGTMGGLTDKGFNYNGAWGGTMAMGGSLPGSVGFTYERTQSPAPSNGPYAKKTKASAQNGQEMKFYQEGLDWKPKNISRDGGWLSKYEGGGIIEDPMGQWAHPGEITRIPSNQITMQGVDYPVLGISDTGDTKMMQPGKDYKFKGKSVTEIPMMQEGGPVEKTYGTYRLPEVVITGQAPEKGFWDQSISSFLNENKDAGLLGALSSVVTYPLGLPQQAMMYGLTGKVQRPSEALNIKNPIGAFATDAIADPTNFLGVGLADDALKLRSAGKLFSKEKAFSENIGDISNEQLKRLNQFFTDEQRFDRLKQTTNPKSLGVLNDFKTRVSTPEGQRRMKDLGITREDILQNISIVEDPTDYGYYRPSANKIAMHPDHLLPRKVARHEIEHGVQNASRLSLNDESNKWYNFFSAPNRKKTTNIDDLLSSLELRNEPDLNRVWDYSKDAFPKPIDISDYKEKILNRQNATDYFATGSQGKEKSAFLAEVQQYMMDQGMIPKDNYVEITPEMIKQVFADSMFDETGGGKYLRLFNIMRPTEDNYKLVSQGLNKMLTVSPMALGAGAIGSQINQPSQQKNGGWLNKYK